MIRRPPSSPLFPSTTLFRSEVHVAVDGEVRQRPAVGREDQQGAAGFAERAVLDRAAGEVPRPGGGVERQGAAAEVEGGAEVDRDPKATRVNSSHANNSDADF